MDESIEFLTEEIRRYYTKRRQSELNNNYISFNLPKHTAAFTKAAELCKKLEADPEFYIHAQFMFIDADKLIPEFLHSKNAEENYKTYMSRSNLTLPASYKLQMQYLVDQVSLALRPVELALMDKHLNFRPWFRVCITKEPVPEIVAEYGEAAKEEYEKDKNLREFMAKLKLDHTRFTK